MGRHKWADKRFGERIKVKRDGRGWSQADMARALRANGIEPMHATTIAKIEAGDRSVRINEAVGIADLFGVPLDALLGRESGPERELDYAMGAFLDAVYTSRTGLGRVARPLRDRLDDIPSDFNGHDTLVGHVRDVSVHLDRAGEALRQLEDQLSADLEMQVAERLFGKMSTEKGPQE